MIWTLKKDERPKNSNVLNMKYLYFYIGPDGTLKPNDRLYPVDLLRAITGEKEGLFFRFAFEPEAKRIFVQDESFRNKLRKGDEQAWTYFNHALDNLNKKAKARFLDRKWGDPQDSGITRPLSHFAYAWRDLNEILNEEFGIKPEDINIYEYVALPDRDERVSLLGKGATIGDFPVNQPMIAINRTHPSLSKEGDVDFKALNKALLIFYLSKMPEIFKALGKEDLVELTKNAASPATMFAIRDKDKTRIFDGKDDLDEEKIRQSIGDYKGPVVIFDLDHSCKKVCFRNKMLSDFADQGFHSLYDDILNSCAKVLRIPKNDVFSSFDHSLSTGFISKISRMPIAWNFLKEANENMPDIPVVMLPFQTDAKVVRNSDEEDEKSKLFRATRGADIPYPFLTLPHRMSRGKLLRTTVDKCLSYCHGEAEEDMSIEEFLGFLDKTKPIVKKDMQFLIGMGLPKKDILDFFCKEFNLFKRAEYRKVYEEVMGEMSKHTEGRKVLASMGPGLQINEHYVRIQDYINDAKHTNKKKEDPIIQPMKKHIAPRSYEQLLRTKHDKEMSSMKMTEQLLRESQI